MDLLERYDSLQIAAEKRYMRLAKAYRKATGHDWLHTSTPFSFIEESLTGDLSVVEGELLWIGDGSLPRVTVIKTTEDETGRPIDLMNGHNLRQLIRLGMELEAAIR